MAEGSGEPPLSARVGVTMVEQVSARRAVALNAIVAAAYAALGILALRIAEVGVSAPLWPAAGVAFAFVYRWRSLVIPGVFVGSVIANSVTLLIAGAGAWVPSVASLLVGVGAAVQALVGSRLAHRYVGGRTRLESPREILLFLLLAGPVSAVIAASVGTATQVATGILSANQAAAAWLVWWVGDAIGIIVFGPLTLMLLPDLRHVWTGRRWKIAVPSLIVTAMLVGGVVVNDQLAHDQLRSEQGHFVDDALSTLDSLLRQHEEALDGIRGLELASDEVTIEEFRTFSAPILARYPSMQAVSWNPVVPDEQRAAFEAQQRQQEGLRDYQITERDAEGNLVPAAARPSHVVVQYIEPTATNEAALGFDIASNPARLEAIERAVDTGQSAVTASIDLVQDDDSQKGVLVLTPSFAGGQPPDDIEARRADVEGFAVGVYRMNDLVETVYADPKWDDVAIRLVDVTDVDEPVILAERSAVSVPTIDLAKGTSDPIDVEPFDMLGRTWALEIVPVAGSLVAPSSGPATLLLMIALVGVYLFEALLILLTGLEQKARREASEKSYEATHDALTGVVNRRGFIDQLETLCRRAEADEARHVLLFADLDHFKQVNDSAGHEVGDEMLIEVARAIRGNVRGADTVARIGGDEFAVILRDCPLPVGERTATAIADSIDAIRLPSRAGEMTVGVSVGMAAFGAGATLDPDEALRQADAAAYVAKEAHGSAVQRSDEVST